MLALGRSIRVAATSSAILKTPFLKLASTAAISKPHLSTLSSSSSSNNRTGEDEWNDAWEAAWLPEDLNPTDLAPWETGIDFPPSESASPPVALPSDVDSETNAFVEDIKDNWVDRQKGQNQQLKQKQKENGSGSGLYSLENIKRDYRLKKQRIHAGLWTKEIEKLEEAKLGGSAAAGGGHDIDRLLDSCSEIFDYANEDMNDSKNPISSEFKNKPEGWETASKVQDGTIWDMSQREEDILLQEFDRRIAYSKFQIASFIKTHIFSRRRPIDGWKYMIEELGPNAKRKGKGCMSRLPSLSDPSTQPFKEESSPTKSRHTASRRR